MFRLCYDFFSFFFRFATLRYVTLYVSVRVCLRFAFVCTVFFFRVVRCGAVRCRAVSCRALSFRMVLFRFVAGSEGHQQLGKDTPANGRAGPSPVDAYPGTVIFGFLGGFPCGIPMGSREMPRDPFPTTSQAGSREVPWANAQITTGPRGNPLSGPD